MIRNPILTPFDLLSRLWRPNPRNLHSAFLHPNKLPQLVKDCPSAMRILDLLVSIPWEQFPERNGSGSKYMIMGNSQVVLNNEPTSDKMMHILDFRKG